MRYWKTFLSAVLGGLAISLGGCAYLSLESKLAGAIFFVVGLFTICHFGLHLFTGKVCYFFQRDRAFRLALPVIWLGNLAGAMLTGWALTLTRQGSVLMERAQAVCAGKLADGFLSLFLLGIFCNLLIYIAVEGFSAIADPVGRHMALFFGVTVFILCGFEHCVADMFYFTAAGVWSPDVLLRLLVITAGNAVGAVLLPLLRAWSAEK